MLRLQLAHALQLDVRQPRLGLRRLQLRARRGARRLAILRIETGEQLPGLHRIADLDRARGNLAGDAKAVARLHAWTDLGRKRQRDRGMLPGNRDDAHRTRRLVA